MSYTDYYLKAPTQEAFEAACPWMGEDGVITDSHNHAMSIVGILSYGGEYDREGNETKAPTVVEGYHVNLRLRDGVALPESLVPFVVSRPLYPKRIFAD